MRYGAGDDRTRGHHSARQHRGDESGQGSHAWNMPSGADIYDSAAGRQARTSKDCHSQAPTSSPWHLDPTTVAAPEATCIAVRPVYPQLRATFCVTHIAKTSSTAKNPEFESLAGTERADQRWHVI